MTDKTITVAAKRGPVSCDMMIDQSDVSSRGPRGVCSGDDSDTETFSRFVRRGAPGELKQWCAGGKQYVCKGDLQTWSKRCGDQEGSKS
jgi:hypothetical protein